MPFPPDAVRLRTAPLPTEPSPTPQPTPEPVSPTEIYGVQGYSFTKTLPLLAGKMYTAFESASLNFLRLDAALGQDVRIYPLRGTMPSGGKGVSMFR